MENFSSDINVGNGRSSDLDQISSATVTTIKHTLPCDPKKLSLYQDALSLSGVRIKVNEMGKQLFVSFDRGGSWERWTAEMEGKAYRAVQRHCRFDVFDKRKPDTVSFTREVRQLALHDLILRAENRYHPLRDYLSDLKPAMNADMAKAVCHCLKIDPDGEIAGRWGEDAARSYYADGIMAVALGVVRRTLRPGSHHDLFVVLRGEDGCGKSLFWEEMLPDRTWFTNSFIFSPDTRRMFLQCKDYGLIEVQEMFGGSRTDNQTFKAFVSNSFDVVEVKYQQLAERTERSFILVGTTNDSRFIPADPSQDRRVAVLPVGKNANEADQIASNVKRWWSANRNCFWAHVLYLYREGKTGLLGEWRGRSQNIYQWLSDRAQAKR